MKRYCIALPKKQYSKLTRMLTPDNARRLAELQPISGRSLFRDLLDEIYSPVTDGWSTKAVVLEESEEELALLRALTVYVHPNKPDFFVRQLSRRLIRCGGRFEFVIDLDMKS